MIEKLSSAFCNKIDNACLPCDIICLNWLLAGAQGMSLH